jgi:hypothetical protein
LLAFSDGGTSVPGSACAGNRHESGIVWFRKTAHAELRGQQIRNNPPKFIVSRPAFRFDVIEAGLDQVSLASVPQETARRTQAWHVLGTITQEATVSKSGDQISLSLTVQRITRAVILRHLNNGLSYRQLVHAAISNAILCVVSVACVAALAFFRKHQGSFFSDPPSLLLFLNAIIFGLSSTWKFYGALQETKRVDL